MGTLEVWFAKVGRIVRSRKAAAAILVAFLVLGFILISVASTTDVRIRETRHFDGQVAPFSERRDALAVPGAAFDGVGFAEATTPDLECGVGVVFLARSELLTFEVTGQLPLPQLHCDQTATRLSGSIAAVFVENQRPNGTNWSFDLRLFDVSYPYALYGVPAIGLLLAAGLGLPVMFLQSAVPRWMGAQLYRHKKD